MGEKQKLLSIQNFIEQRMGLNAHAIGTHAWNRALQVRMKGLGLDSLDAYTSRLLNSHFEGQELTELLVNTETWFFRDPAAFDYLRRHIAERGLPPHAGPWKILSLGCSTGEEAYTIVMALLDSGLTADRIAVEAVDISRRALEKAALAVYGANSFRSSAPRLKYLDGLEKGYRVKAEVRGSVRFRVGNVADPHFFLGGQKFDAIFCRNILIYQTFEAQRQTLRHCNTLLGRDGLFFVGPTEGELAKEAGFESISPAAACGFRFPVETMAMDER